MTPRKRSHHARPKPYLSEFSRYWAWVRAKPVLDEIGRRQRGEEEVIVVDPVIGCSFESIMLGRLELFERARAWDAARRTDPMADAIIRRGIKPEPPDLPF